MEFRFENVVAERLPVEVVPPTFGEVQEPLFFMLPELIGSMFDALTPALLIILSPVFFVIRNCIRIYLISALVFGKLRSVAIAKIVDWWMETFEDPKMPLNQKCPACGHRREHKISYMREYKRVMHQCAVCSAVFAVPCVLDVAKWEVAPIQESEAQSKAPWVV